MGFPRLNFSKLWTNPTDFPTVELDESQVRADMQALHDETKAGLNGLMDKLEDKGAAGSLGAKANDGSTVSTVQKELDALNKALTEAGNLPTGGTEGQVLMKKSADAFDTEWGMPTAAQVGAVAKTDRAVAKDCNAITEEGRYFLISAVNGPYAHGFLEVKYYHGGLFAPESSWGQTQCIRQTFEAYGTTSKYERVGLYKQSVSTEWEWSAWAQLATTDYAVSKAGDTMTGALTAAAFAATDYNSVLEIGKYIDMHDSDSTSDYDVRLAVYDGNLMVSSAVAVYDTLLHTGNVDSLLGAAKIVSGTYTGDGGTTSKTLYEQTISLGFTPKMVFVWSEYGMKRTDSGSSHQSMLAVTGQDVTGHNCTLLKITANGFTAASYTVIGSAQSYYDSANSNGEVYRYIAIG